MLVFFQKEFRDLTSWFLLNDLDAAIEIVTDPKGCIDPEFGS